MFDNQIDAIMKYVSFLFFLMWASSLSQTELKQNYSDDIDQNISCIDSSTGILYNTKVYRSFGEESNPFNGRTFVEVAYFAIGTISENIDITITLYAATGNFPDATLEVRGVTTYSATPADAFSIIQAPIEAQFVNGVDDSIVYELSVSGNGTVSFGFGSNTLGQDAPSYIKAADCLINDPTDLEDVGLQDSIVMYLEVTGEFIGFEDETKSKFKLYPNPTDNKLSFTGDSQIENIKVHDITARLLIDTSVYSNHFTLDTSELSSGEYIVTIFSEGKRQHSKFLKF